MALMLDLFELKSYKPYFSKKLESLPRGGKSDLARQMNCHLSYLSQVVSSHSQLTLEQAASANRFFGHGKWESEYFLFLVHYERAGTQELRSFYEKRLEEIRNIRNKIQSRLPDSESLELTQQTIYYSQWFYLAIHVLTSSPKTQTIESIAKALGLTPLTVKNICHELEEMGLVKSENGKWLMTEKRIHLPPHSPLISKHHMNWRVQAVKALEFSHPKDLHFSTLYTFSKADADKVTEHLLALTEKLEALVKNTEPENAYCLNFDYFELNSTPLESKNLHD